MQQEAAAEEESPQTWKTNPASARREAASQLPASCWAAQIRRHLQKKTGLPEAQANQTAKILKTILASATGVLEG